MLFALGSCLRARCRRATPSSFSAASLISFWNPILSLPSPPPSQLHQLMPPLLTCVVGKRLGREGNDAHWTLRRESAQVVAGLCRQHSARYAELQSRVLKTMLSSLLDKTKPLSTHYGASVCFAAFGPRVVDKFLVVNLPPYFKIWESKRHTEPEAAEHVKDALQVRLCRDGPRAVACLGSR